MEPRSILQIVSGFKPSVDGMGDFSMRLGAVLWMQHSIRSHFLVYRRPQSPSKPEEIFPNTLSYPKDATPSAFRVHLDELLRERKFGCVLLHYGPYAYSSKGRPAAFVDAIEELAKSTRLVVFLHEMFASGMPWRRAFWTKPEQKRCVAALLRIADVAITSNAGYREGMQPVNFTDREILEIPIFSNLGEPDRLRPLSQRTRQLVVFGQLATRLQLYRKYRSSLQEVCNKLRIEKIVDVGSGQSALIPKTVARANVVTIGFMEEQQLSDLMADSIAGIICYHPNIWQKSGVIAAYQAHALVPILVETHKRSICGPDFLPYVSPERISQLAAEGTAASDASIQAIADAAHTAYLRNQSVDRCAEVIARCAFPD